MKKIILGKAYFSLENDKKRAFKCDLSQSTSTNTAKNTSYSNRNKIVPDIRDMPKLTLNKTFSDFRIGKKPLSFSSDKKASTSGFNKN